MQDGIISVWSAKTETGETCPFCRWWYKWRIGLFEMMDYTDEIKVLLLGEKSAFDIENYALQHGMINLERDGIFKVIQGITTLEEVYAYVKTQTEI